MSRLRSAFWLPPRPVWRLSLVFALLALTVLTLNGVVGANDLLQTGALTMLPAIAVAVAMVTRPYLGEHVIVRLRSRRRRCRGVVAKPFATGRRAASMARGGRLIAVALAGRAPPLVSAGCF
jgi:hypothetical protein